MHVLETPYPTEANLLSDDIGTSKIPLQSEKQVLVKSPTYKDISMAFQTTFPLASVVFLALISLERAHALIWPLRHDRVSNTKIYMYVVIFVWLAVISTPCTLSLLRLCTASWIMWL